MRERGANGYESIREEGETEKRKRLGSECTCKRSLSRTGLITMRRGRGGGKKGEGWPEAATGMRRAARAARAGKSHHEKVGWGLGEKRARRMEHEEVTMDDFSSLYTYMYFTCRASASSPMLRTRSISQIRRPSSDLVRLLSPPKTPCFAHPLALSRDDLLPASPASQPASHPACIHRASPLPRHRPLWSRPNQGLAAITP